MQRMSNCFILMHDSDTLERLRELHLQLVSLPLWCTGSTPIGAEGVKVVQLQKEAD